MAPNDAMEVDGGDKKTATTLPDNTYDDDDDLVRSASIGMQVDSTIAAVQPLVEF